ncbi:MAG: transporter substrate-binding domain-containing protein [Pseudomonadota bacterium]
MDHQRRVRRSLAGLLAFACAFASTLALPASAACSRPILVPVSAIGKSVIIKGEGISGAYPDLLRDLGAKYGCDFQFTAVPRARQEALFATAKADLLVPATRTPRRDALGYFVPVISTRATLISIDAKRAAIHTMGELREQKSLRIALVRGFDYGPAYQALVQELTAQGRLYLEPDAIAVARLINGGMADATIMAPMIFAGAVQDDGRVEAMLAKMRIEAVEELPWTESGLYISRSSVSKKDRAALEAMLAAAVKSGAAWDAYKRFYSPDVLNLSVRPR